MLANLNVASLLPFFTELDMAAHAHCRSSQTDHIKPRQVVWLHDSTTDGSDDDSAGVGQSLRPMGVAKVRKSNGYFCVHPITTYVVASLFSLCFQVSSAVDSFT